MSDLAAEVLLRLVKPAVAGLVGLLLYAGLVTAGALPSAELLLLSWLSAAAFILLMQESPL